MNIPRVKKPWYREPWPWILMTGPFIVIIAACYTGWLAYAYGDPLVTDDYYRKGLQVEHTIASSERAKALALQAKVSLRNDTLHLTLRAQNPFVLPEGLRVTLSHPTRAGLDQNFALSLLGGTYVGRLQVPQSGHWILLLEDDLQTWRLLAKVVLPTDTEFTITALQ